MEQGEPLSGLYGSSVRDEKVFTLAGSGSVRLTAPELAFVQAREFQRLDGIRQLGTAHFVFRSAKHTRFEHALGTLHEAEGLIQRVNRNPDTAEVFDRDAHVLVRLAALAHDLGHIPFSHTVEDELSLLERHDRNDARLARLLSGEVGDALRVSAGDLYDELLRVLSAVAGGYPINKLEYPFVADLVGNTVCADMLDYVKRDMLACGLAYGLGDRFLDFFRITPESDEDLPGSRRMALALDRRGKPRPDVESDVLKLLTMRYELTDRVYFHHAKNAASVMLGRAIRAAGFVNDSRSDEPFDLMRDERLLDCLRDPVFAASWGFDPAAAHDAAMAAELADLIERRQFYKARWVGVHDDLASSAERLWGVYGKPHARENLEDDLADAGGLPPGHVLVHIPPPKMLLKAADVLVTTASGDVAKLREWDARHSRRTHALTDAHERLWRMAVYVHPDATEQQWRLVRERAVDEFGVESRYQPGDARSRWAHELFNQEAEKQHWYVSDRPAALAAADDSAFRRDDVAAAMREKIEASRSAHSRAAAAAPGTRLLRAARRWWSKRRALLR